MIGKNSVLNEPKSKDNTQLLFAKQIFNYNPLANSYRIIINIIVLDIRIKYNIYVFFLNCFCPAGS